MASSQRRVIAWDTSIFIDAMDTNQANHQYANAVLKEAEAPNSEFMIVGSWAVLMELLKVDNKAWSDAELLIERFVRKPCFSLRNADYHVCKIAQGVRRKAADLDKKIEGADAIHLATAIAFNAEVFLTRDGDKKERWTKLLKFDGKFNTEAGTPLHILTPKDWHQARKNEEFSIPRATPSA